MRATKDIDISVEIASISQLDELRENLTAKGFIQTADLKVICRFKLEEILLDVMGTKPIDNREHERVKRVHFDYNLGIKLALVAELEKAITHANPKDLRY